MIGLMKRSNCVYPTFAFVATTLVLCMLAHGYGLISFSTPGEVSSNLRAPHDFAATKESTARHLAAKDRDGLEVTKAEAGPLLLPLHRESVPVRRQGKVVSFKTSYSSFIRVGSPVPQQFRVVFDTGSGHVILPSSECDSPTCMKHNRYDASASDTSVPINVDGEIVPVDELRDQATIGFGTGQVTGEFARDVVCMGPDAADEATDKQAAIPPSYQSRSSEVCIEMQIVAGVQMTKQPFKAFEFDGIIGLGLSSLALSQNFSFLGRLSESEFATQSHFGVFLTEGENGEESEIAFGGYNPKRLLEPLKWTPLTKQELGYWQVQILAVRVNGHTLDVCEDGTCRGVMDTGTSHLGIPALHAPSISEQLTVEAEQDQDCRVIQAPTVEIEIPGFNISLTPENYMRKMPLKEGVMVGSSTGVTLTSSTGIPNTPDTATESDLEDESVRQFCRPRIMPVDLPQPLGPKLFILGEPVLHRYYSVYDWKEQRIGIGLAASRRNLEAHEGMNLMATDGDVSSLMQQSIVVRRAVKKVATANTEELDDDEIYLVQTTITVRTRISCL